jgi:sugar phosphate isomerase/epimerase
LGIINDKLKVKMDLTTQLSRKEFLSIMAALSIGAKAAQGYKGSQFLIGACDWSIGAAGQLSAFDTAKAIGLDGVQLSFNTITNQYHLADPNVQQQYLAASKASGVSIASIGIALLNNVPFKSEDRTDEWVSLSIDAAKALGVSTVLLAFFEKNDLRNDPQGKKVVIEKLKKVMPKAEKLGINLAIESYLSAQEHLEIIEAVGSKSLKVYYDFRNATDAGYDIYQEIPMLKGLISEIHIKENGLLLGQGTIDWPKVAMALASINYQGWMQIEWSMPNNASIVPSYQHNLNYLKKIFP